MAETEGKPKPRRRRTPSTVAPVKEAIEGQAAIRAAAQESAENLLRLRRDIGERWKFGSRIQELIDQAGGPENLRAGLTGANRLYPELAKALEQLQADTEARRKLYGGIIDTASTSARLAYERASQPAQAMATITPRPSPEAQQVTLLEELHTEVSRVSGTVGDMATSIVTLATVAERAEAGLDELAVLSKAALEEAGQLRVALIDGQKAAVRAAWVIGVLTAVLVVLTLVLAWKAIAP